MEIITIPEAKARGLKRYFTGKPCKHGHVSERLVSNAGCCECSRLCGLVENMTPEQIERERARGRVRHNSDMTPEQYMRYEATSRQRLTNQLRAKFKKQWG